jgi:hypothetical protein
MAGAAYKAMRQSLMQMSGVELYTVDSPGPIHQQCMRSCICICVEMSADWPWQGAPPPLVASTAMPLAASCGEPPPKEMIQSHCSSVTIFIPSFTCRTFTSLMSFYLKDTLKCSYNAGMKPAGRCVNICGWQQLCKSFSQPCILRHLRMLYDSETGLVCGMGRHTNKYWCIRQTCLCWYLLDGGIGLYTIINAVLNTDPLKY